MDDAVSPEAARQWLLETFPAAWEDFPFGPGTRTFKNARGKLFALMTDEAPGAFRITMKLGRDAADEALVLPFVSIAPYVGRHGWVTVQVEQPPEWELAQEWVARSWELVSNARHRPKR